MDDPPTSRGMTREEIEKFNKEGQYSQITVPMQFNESRLKEAHLEKVNLIKIRESNAKLKVREIEPNIEWSQPMVVDTLKTLTSGLQSEEVAKQKQRESRVFVAHYVKESQIPSFPQEIEQKQFTELSDGVKIFRPKLKRMNPHPETESLKGLLQICQKTVQQPTVPVSTSASAIAKDIPETENSQKADSRNKPQRYKTIPCRMYHSQHGSCTRGEMCHFIHNPQFIGRELPEDLWKCKKKSVPEQQPFYQYPPAMPNPYMFHFMMRPPPPPPMMPMYNFTYGFNPNPNQPNN